MNPLEFLERDLTTFEGASTADEKKAAIAVLSKWSLRFKIATWNHDDQIYFLWEAVNSAEARERITRDEARAQLQAFADFSAFEDVRKTAVNELQQLHQKELPYYMREASNV